MTDRLYSVECYSPGLDRWTTVALFDTKEGADAYAWGQVARWNRAYRVRLQAKEPAE